MDVTFYCISFKTTNVNFTAALEEKSGDPQSRIHFLVCQNPTSSIHCSDVVYWFSVTHTHTRTHITDQRCVSQLLWEPVTPQRRARRCSAVILTSSGFALFQLTGWDRGNWCHVWFCQRGGQVTRDSERPRETKGEKTKDRQIFIFNPMVVPVKINPFIFVYFPSTVT